MKKGFEAGRVPMNDNDSREDVEKPVIAVDRAYIDRLDVKAPGRDGDVWQCKEHLMRAVRDIKQGTLLEDPEFLLFDLLDAIHPFESRISSEEQKRMELAKKRNQRYSDDRSPLKLEEGAILSDDERAAINNAFAHVRRTAWNAYNKLRAAKEQDLPHIEAPPALPSDDRMLEYLRMMLDSRQPGDFTKRLQLLLEAATVILDDPLISSDDPKFYSNIAFYLRRIWLSETFTVTNVPLNEEIASAMNHFRDEGKWDVVEKAIEHLHTRAKELRENKDQIS
jgi:hypothetical protein